MDQNRFERLRKALIAIPSRRDVLRGFAGVGLGVGVSRLPEVAEAKKKRKPRKKPRKAEPNEFGCLNVGNSCKNGDQCCSGICEGKKGKKRCKAHDAGSCAAGAQLAYCGGTDVTCTSSAGVPGECATTTGNAGYCVATGYCIACATDADCLVADGGILGPHTACIRCAACSETGGTACAVPDLPAET